MTPKMPLDPSLSRTDLVGLIFIYSPVSESMSTSAKRLVNAMRADGVFTSLSRTSVWYTYRKHPELLKQ